MSPRFVNLNTSTRRAREEGGTKVTLTKAWYSKAQKGTDTIKLRQTIDVETPIAKADRDIACMTYKMNTS